MIRYALLIFASSTGIAAAAGLSMSDKMALKEACENDIRTLCHDVKPGDGALAACIKEHKDAVSQPCQQTFSMLAPKMKKD